MSKLVSSENVHQKYISESLFEYLLGEIMVLSETDSVVQQNLDKLGYDVGYRYEKYYAIDLAINYSDFYSVY